MQRVVSDLDGPELAGALAERGLALARAGPALGPDTAALLLRWRTDAGEARRLVASVRKHGWRGPLMLVGGARSEFAGALDAGADDVAPADAPPPEIAARIAARVRGRTVRVGALTFDPEARDVERESHRLGLLPREYALLAYLAARPDETIGRSELLAAIWGMRIDPGTNVVAVHVSRLRARLASAGVPILHTDRGRGYRLSP